MKGMTCGTGSCVELPSFAYMPGAGGVTFSTSTL